MSIQVDSAKVRRHANISIDSLYYYSFVAIDKFNIFAA